jgi:hypothetical protein
LEPFEKIETRMGGKYIFFVFNILIFGKTKKDSTAWNSAGSLCILVGRPDEDVLYSKSGALQVALLFEFNDNI